MRSKIFSTVALAAILAAALTPASAADEPAQTGRWIAPFWEGGAVPNDPPSNENSKAYPTAGSAIVLPDGRLLYWNALEGSENGELWVGQSDGTVSSENARARVLDLRSGTPQWKTPAKERGTTDKPHDEGQFSTKDLFCADQKLLYDGTVLVAGGSEWRVDLVNDPAGSDVHGEDETRIFDPATDTFSNAGQMGSPRWYPSLVTLADGRVLVTSGVKRLVGSFAEPGTSFSQVRTSEIYDPRTKTWSAAGTSDWSFPLYPRLHTLPDGKVFYGGAGQVWGQFGETPDQATWALQRTYDPATEKWTPLGHTRYGVRGGATSTLLRLEPPYTRAEVLLAGGTLGSSPGSWVGTTLSEKVTWENGTLVNEESPKLPLAGLAGDQTQLRNPRWFGTSIMLPTGEVLLVNGGDMDDTVDPGSAAGVRAPELYNPQTGTWTRLASAQRDRIYHNTAVLLPDGRVLVGGNAPHHAHFTRHDNTLSRNNNFRDSTFEIFEPPYLFRGDRPVINSVALSGDQRALELDATGGDEVVLVRLGAVTHAQDSDMRAVTLERTVNPDGSITAKLPKGGDGRIVPPGPYYVFVNSADGVPSIARTVLVQPDTAGGGVVFATP